MRRLWFMAVILLVGCGPSGAPRPEKVKSVASRPAMPSRPAKSAPNAPTEAPPASTDPSATDFRESGANSAFELLPVSPAELAEARRPIDALATHFESFLPGFARQLRWVLSRRIEVHRGSLVALLNEGPHRFMMRADPLSFSAQALHHEGGLVFRDEAWTGLTADARSLLLLTSILEHLMQFEVNEKTYCLSYRKDPKSCASTWEPEIRGPKPSKFIALKAVARTLLSGSGTLMNANILIGMLKPLGFQAPYVRLSVTTGAQILASLRELDGRALAPVTALGDRAAVYAAASACRLRVGPDSLRIELEGTSLAPLELKWTFKNEDSFENDHDAEIPPLQTFHAAGPGSSAEVLFDPAKEGRLTVKLNELKPGSDPSASVATTLVCGHPAPEAP